jgi:hypothetical protein
VAAATALAAQDCQVVLGGAPPCCRTWSSILVFRILAADLAFWLLVVEATGHRLAGASK